MTLPNTKSNMMTGRGVSSKVNRNLLINGDFQIWQRGYTFSIDGSGAGYGYTADKWYSSDLGAGNSSTVTRESFVMGQSDVEGSPKYYLKNVRNGISVDTREVGTHVEDVTLFSDKVVTISFYAKGEGNWLLTVYQNFGIGGSPSDAVEVLRDYAPLTSSWTKYSFTFRCPSILGKTIGTDGLISSSLWIRFRHSSPPGAASYEISLAQAQLVEGVTSPPFHSRIYSEELFLCQRYCYGLDSELDSVIRFGDLGIVADDLPSVIVYISGSFPVEMRGIPSVSYSALSDFIVYGFAVLSPFEPTAIAVHTGSGLGGRTSKQTYVLKITGAGESGTVGAITFLRAGTTTSARLVFESELRTY
jgi:hypothetical protein